MRLLKNYLPLATLAFLFYQCEPDPGVNCDRYFISEIKSGETISDKIFFNEDGLISSRVIEDDVQVYNYDFTYNESGKLIKVSGFNPGIEFSYDEAGELIQVAAYNLDRTTIGQYISYEYDGSGRLAQTNFLDAEMKRWSFKTYTYVDSKTILTEFYLVNGTGDYSLESTLRYTLDQHPKPYPEEWYTLVMGWGFDVIPHNETRVERIVNGAAETLTKTTYDYNADGYPLRGGSIQYVYSCNPQMK